MIELQQQEIESYHQVTHCRNSKLQQYCNNNATTMQQHCNNTATYCNTTATPSTAIVSRKSKLQQHCSITATTLQQHCTNTATYCNTTATPSAERVRYNQLCVCIGGNIHCGVES